MPRRLRWGLLVGLPVGAGIVALAVVGSSPALAVTGVGCGLTAGASAAILVGARSRRANEDPLFVMVFLMAGLALSQAQALVEPGVPALARRAALFAIAAALLGTVAALWKRHRLRRFLATHGAGS